MRQINPEEEKEKLITRLLSLEDTVQRLVDGKKALERDIQFLQEITSSHGAILYKHTANPPALVWVSNNVEKILGYTPPDFIKGGIEFFLSNCRQNQYVILNQFMDFLKGNGADYSKFIYDYRTKKGNWITLVSLASIVKKGKNNVPWEVITVSIPFSSSDKEVISSFNSGKLSKNIGKPANISLLTQREHEVTCHLALGNSTKKISTLLGISQNTVITHKKNIYKKLHLNNIAEITRFALVNGLIT